MRVLHIFIFTSLIALVSKQVTAQRIDLNQKLYEAVGVFDSLIKNRSETVLRVVKDPRVIAVDEPTFVKIQNVNFKNGLIEVKVLSKLLPNAADSARGFIGLAFRINTDNTQFESIYIRPTNGRANVQLRRNRAVQYFSYPDFKYNVLRTIAPGMYESYADMGLNEWIQLKIEVENSQAKLYINNSKQPVLIVNDLKHGANAAGAIGLFVDIGTEGYFKDLVVIPK
ncbi:MAG: hypothetical protein KA311_06180 [Sediminibacterium sp.]|nr:hypothetical protein [Sediminibacterium sp.]